MPRRDGKIVDWKWKIPRFGKLIQNEDISTGDKLATLAKIVKVHPAFDDSDSLDDFADRLLEAAEIEDEDEQELAGDGVLSEIYDYADDNLIWLGAA